MGIVGGFDIHRRQITFDYLDERSGETRHGRIAPADRMLLRSWLEHLLADTGTSAAFAVEGCTGWRFVVEELQRAGAEAHLAEPADTAAARGPKWRAKTDRADARLLRELLARLEPVAVVRTEQVTGDCRGALVQQDRVDALHPAGVLLAQVLEQLQPGAHLQHVRRRNPRFGQPPVGEQIA